MKTIYGIIAAALIGMALTLSAVSANAQTYSEQRSASHFTSGQLDYLESYFLGVWMTRVGTFSIATDYQGGNMNVYIEAIQANGVVLQDIDPHHQQIVIGFTNNKGMPDMMIFRIDHQGRMWLNVSGADMLLDFVRRLNPVERASIASN